MNLPCPSGRAPLRPLVLCIIVFTCLTLWPAATKVSAQGGIPGYVVLPLALMEHSNQATLRIEVNGNSTMLVVDTGAPLTLLDSEFYRGTLPKGGDVKPADLPPELRKKTSANGQRAQFGMASDLKAGGFDFGKHPVVLTDLRDTLARYNNSHAKAAISGLLGEDMLHEYSAIIDWRRRGLYLNVDKSKRLKLGPGLIAAGWTAVPMAATSGHHFSVEATVEGKRVRLVVDTGAGFTTFVPDVVHFSHMMYHIQDSTGTRLQTTALTMSMINSSSTAFPARIDHWKLGNYEIDSSVVSVTKIPASFLKEQSAGEGPILGFVGAEVLARNSAIVDVAGSTLYLKPSNRLRVRQSTKFVRHLL